MRTPSFATTFLLMVAAALLLAASPRGSSAPNVSVPNASMTPTDALDASRSATPPDTLPESETYEPSEDLGPLFVAVQLAGLFEDSKTFADARPTAAPASLVERYRAERDHDGFDLRQFVEEHFILPATVAVHDAPPTEAPAVTPSMPEHLVSLWDELTRSPTEAQRRSSLLPLPHPYVMPGGRFREIYYWDSYFTMLGLVASGRMELTHDMARNFAFLAQRYGFLPNGNRSYYLTRPQPPLFSSMVALVAQTDGIESALKYLAPLRLEYAYWMNGRNQLTRAGTAEEHVVRLPGNVALNRYWDRKAVPRPESFSEDYRLAQPLPERERPALYRNLRAAAASGWDFSSRWYQDGDDLAATATTHIVPVDLNSLLYHTEHTLARLYDANGQPTLAEAFHEKAARRRAALLRYCWDDEQGFFYDYNFRTGERTDAVTMAAFFPLYYGLADSTQARRVAEKAEAELLRPGGFAATATSTDQQWDAPNGWAPMQWIAVRGLERYGLDALAGEASERWIGLNRRVYQRTGRMVEKYNVVDTDLRAGGGEYPAQDGFGWTNGVALALLRDLHVSLYGPAGARADAASSGRDTSEALPFRTLAQSANGPQSFDGRRHVVFERESELASFWNALPGGASGTEIPNVDFDGGERAVAVLLGERRSGGHRVDVQAVKRTPDRATVHVTETTPGPGCSVTTALTSPFHLVAVENAPAEGFTFEIKTRTEACR